jgi:hypothetical protein
MFLLLGTPVMFLFFGTPLQSELPYVSVGWNSITNTPSVFFCWLELLTITVSVSFCCLEIHYDHSFSILLLIGTPIVTQLPYVSIGWNSIMNTLSVFFCWLELLTITVSVPFCYLEIHYEHSFNILLLIGTPTVTQFPYVSVGLTEPPPLVGEI